MTTHDVDLVARLREVADAMHITADRWITPIAHAAAAEIERLDAVRIAASGVLQELRDECRALRARVDELEGK